MQESNCFGKYQILLVALITIYASSGRQYNLEEESQRIYKQEFSSVLAKFRRTPTYLKILTRKADQFEEDLSDMQMQIFYSYKDKLDEHILKTFNVSDDVTPGPSTTPSNRRRFAKWRRQNLKEEEDDPIKALDNYIKTTSILTAKESKELKDKAFHLFKEFTSTVIKHLNNEAGLSSGDSKISSSSNNNNLDMSTAGITIGTPEMNTPEMSTPEMSIPENTPPPDGGNNQATVFRASKDWDQNLNKMLKKIVSF